MCNETKPYGVDSSSLISSLILAGSILVNAAPERLEGSASGVQGGDELLGKRGEVLLSGLIAVDEAVDLGQDRPRLRLQGAENSQDAGGILALLDGVDSRSGGGDSAEGTEGEERGNDGEEEHR